MRVLHVINTLQGGGAERQLALLAAGLRAEGCEVHIALREGGVNLELAESSGATIHWIPGRSNYDPFTIFRLARIIRQVRPDVLQTWVTQMDVFGGVAAILTRTPWILADRSSGDHYPRDARHLARRILGRHADIIVANSAQGLLGWKNRRRVVIRNAVSIDAIHTANADATDYGDANVVLFVGRLVPEKNVTTLIRALSGIVEESNIVALLCGIGPLEKELRAQAGAAEKSGRIRFLGFRKDIPSLLRRADMLVMPSLFEGHPNVTIEAAAAGCPLIVSDMPAHREFLDDESALFAPPQDASAFARAIQAVIDDPEAATARARHAQNRVREWSVPAAAKAYMSVYEELVDAQVRR
jgi:glycosyltransferase involved in cell wall biosynthesis